MHSIVLGFSISEREKKEEIVCELCGARTGGDTGGETQSKTHLLSATCLISLSLTMMSTT